MTIDNEEQIEPCPDWEPREHIRPEEEKYCNPRYCNVCKSLFWEATGKKSSEVNWEDEEDDSILDTLFCWDKEHKIKATIIFRRST